MRTGILGGTFNPPHLGHLHAAELAHRALNLDRVLFIPTNIPPHKVLPENTASAEDRCEMVRRLTAGSNGYSLAGYEPERMRILRETMARYEGMTPSAFRNVK